MTEMVLCTRSDCATQKFTRAANPDTLPPAAHDLTAEALNVTEGAVKFDENKNPLHLLPFDALEGITEILAFGAKKYAERNWEKGMAWHRPFRACLGHLWAWWRGEEADPETGKSHLLHAGCCILFLIAYERRGVGSDDRPKAGSTFRA